jgi:ribosomal protein L3
MVQKIIDYLEVLVLVVHQVECIREKKMAGQLGGKVVTLKNTEILYVNSKDEILVLKGSVPGKKNTILKIQPQKY